MIGKPVILSLFFSTHLINPVMAQYLWCVRNLTLDSPVTWGKFCVTILEGQTGSFAIFCIQTGSRFYTETFP